MTKTRTRSRRRRQEDTPEEAADTEPDAPSDLSELRNNWQFAALFQFLFLFKQLVKLDDVAILDLENELLGSAPPNIIDHVRVALLQNLSSQRNISTATFDEFVRRQYRQKAAAAVSPYQDGSSFESFDVPTKVAVLHQLCEWQLFNPERFRERMNSKESDEVAWVCVDMYYFMLTSQRIDPVGYDSNENTYFLLDDNRLYARHDPLPPPRKSKAKAAKLDQPESWRCVCATYEDWQAFYARLAKVAKAPERAFYSFLKAEIMPVIESLEQDRIKEEAAKLKQIELLRAHENRKRSSRAEIMAERRREEEAQRARQEQLEREKEQRRIENRRRAQNEKEREARLQARDARLLKHPPPEQERRTTRRATKHHFQNWYFDCVCGAFGENYDDGELSVCCGKCDIWMHVAHLVGDELASFEAAKQSESNASDSDANGQDGDVSMADAEEENVGVDAKIDETDAGLNKENDTTDVDMKHGPDIETKTDGDINHPDIETKTDGKQKENDSTDPEHTIEIGKTDAEQGIENGGNTDVKEENADSHETENQGSDKIEFICNRCMRLERERQQEIQAELKRKQDRERRRERERLKELERRREPKISIHLPGLNVNGMYSHEQLPYIHLQLPPSEPADQLPRSAQFVPPSHAVQAMQPRQEQYSSHAIPPRSLPAQEQLHTLAMPTLPAQGQYPPHAMPPRQEPGHGMAPYAVPQQSPARPVQFSAPHAQPHPQVQQGLPPAAHAMPLPVPVQAGPVPAQAGVPVSLHAANPAVNGTSSSNGHANGTS